MPGSLIKKALTHTKTAPKDYQQEKHQDAQKRLEILQKAKSELLPVDDTLEIDGEIRLCEQTISTQKDAQKTEEIGSYGYQILDKTPFTWRNENGLPHLAPFSLTSNICTITERGVSASFPKSVTKYYEDVPRKLAAPKSKALLFFLGVFATLVPTLLFTYIQPWNNHTFEDKVGGILGCLFGGIIVGGIIGAVIAAFLTEDSKIVTIEARFSGIVPAKTKVEIKKAQELKFFEEIFLLAETTQWDVKMVRPIPKDDPLVIGYDGARFWLITTFDMTSLEKHVADNYAVTADGFTP